MSDSPAEDEGGSHSEDRAERRSRFKQLSDRVRGDQSADEGAENDGDREPVEENATGATSTESHGTEDAGRDRTEGDGYQVDRWEWLGAYTDNAVDEGTAAPPEAHDRGADTGGHDSGKAKWESTDAESSGSDSTAAEPADAQAPPVDGVAGDESPWDEVGGSEETGAEQQAEVADDREEDQKSGGTDESGGTPGSSDRPTVELGRPPRRASREQSSSETTESNTDDAKASASETSAESEPDPTENDSGRIWKRTGRSSRSERFDRDAVVDQSGAGSKMDGEALGGLPFDQVAFDAGTSTLVQCRSQDPRRDAFCVEAVGHTAGDQDRNVLLVRYRKADRDRLEEMARSATRIKLLTIGYSQPIPDAIKGQVETVEINNPSDITRLGILVSSAVSDWADVSGETVLCFDSINVLLRYKEVGKAFRFLHILLGTLDSAETISLFHADPHAGDKQDINTIKPLFDEVISLDDSAQQ